VGAKDIHKHVYSSSNDWTICNNDKNHFGMMLQMLWEKQCRLMSS